MRSEPRDYNDPATWAKAVDVPTQGQPRASTDPSRDTDQIDNLRDRLREADQAMKLDRQRAIRAEAALIERETTIERLTKERDAESQMRISEVDHWVNNYNQLDSWRVETKRQLTALRAEHERARTALKAADEFIRNGIEYGYIRMPDPDSGDSALATPALVRAALAAHEPRDAIDQVLDNMMGKEFNAHEEGK